jgi:hypothetical protein
MKYFAFGFVFGLVILGVMINLARADSFDNDVTSVPADSSPVAGSVYVPSTATSDGTNDVTSQTDDSAVPPATSTNSDAAVGNGSNDVTSQ